MGGGVLPVEMKRDVSEATRSMNRALVSGAVITGDGKVTDLWAFGGLPGSTRSPQIDPVKNSPSLSASGSSLPCVHWL
jgi:hypothetical protein